MLPFADILLASGAICACFYCYVLSKRIKKMMDLESGMGAAVVNFSQNLTDVKEAISNAQKGNQQSEESLAELTARAEGVAQNLELLIASLHDLPRAQSQPKKENDQKTLRNGETAIESSHITTPLFSRRSS